MTFIGIWQDLAMIWVWLGSLLMGGPHSHIPYISSLKASPTLVSLSRIAPAAAPIRHCTYLFRGTVGRRSTMLPGARVLVQLTSPHGMTEKIASVDAQGRYSLELDIDAARHEPVDWSMHTDTDNGLEDAQSGRRIAMDDDRIIVVHDGLDSAPAPPRQPAIRYIPSTPYEEASVG